MDWQLLVVGVVLLLALAYLGRRTLRAWRGAGAGCGECKCSSAAARPDRNGTPETLIPVEQLRLRRR
jgi:hypothetical protein